MKRGREGEGAGGEGKGWEVIEANGPTDNPLLFAACEDA